MAITNGINVPPTSSTGLPIVETGIFVGAPGTKSISMVTPDFSDKTTWYQKSVKVTDETLVDSGDGLTFNSANPWWINIDSEKLTYTHKQIPKRDGTFGRHSDWRISVKVNGTVQNSGYTVDWENGKITFNSSKSGSTVTATYWHLNGVTNPSEWLLVPPPTKKFVIQHVEMQFSQGVNLTDTVRFEIWAGANLATYGSFADALWEAGYGQFRADYRNIRDFINAANEGKGTIPPVGGLTQDVMVMPFNYIQAVVLDSAYGTLFRMCLLNNTPYTGAELATATFYIQIM